MKTLHSYLTRQVLLTLALTVGVFTLVLLLTNLLKEILTLLVNHQATFGIVLQAIGLLIPFVMAFALPMGMLTATLLVFGRFSADQELTAARASGVSLVSLVTPVLLLSVALAIVCGLFNLEIAPKCRIAYKEMLFRLGVEKTTSFIQEDRFVHFPGWVVYARKRDGNYLQDVRLYAFDKGDLQQSLTAPDGRVGIDEPGGKLHLILTNATYLVRTTSRARTEGPATTGTTEVAESEKVTWRPSFQEEFDLEIELPKASKVFRAPKLSEMSYTQLRAETRDLKRQGIDTTPAQVQLQRQVAFSFATIGFTLIGIPLAIRTHRRETTAGVAVALILVLAYYSFIILAQSWQARPELKPYLIVWIPNFLFQLGGGILLWRANKGT